MKAIKSEKFEAVADVLNALQEHDEELNDVIRELKQKQGENDTGLPSAFSERIECIGPSVEFDKLLASIAVSIADRLGRSWDEWFGRLNLFYKAMDIVSLLRSGYKTVQSWGSWVGTVRGRRHLLNAAQIERLRTVDFEWNALEANWELGFRELERYIAVHGHAAVPSAYRVDDFPLGTVGIGSTFIANPGSKAKEHRLNAIGFIWNTKEYDWQCNFIS